MTEYIVGYFDDTNSVGNALIALNNSGLRDQLSLIGREISDTETKVRFDDSDELGIDNPYFGSIAGSISNHTGSIKSLPVSGLGTVTLTGPLSDIITSTESLKSEKLSSLKNAFNLAGFGDYSKNLLTSLKQGRFLLFVPAASNKVKTKVNEILVKYGVLDTEIINVPEIT